jgi:hypothetical protein
VRSENGSARKNDEAGDQPYQHGCGHLRPSGGENSQAIGNLRDRAREMRDGIPSEKTKEKDQWPGQKMNE